VPLSQGGKIAILSNRGHLVTQGRFFNDLQGPLLQQHIVLSSADGWGSNCSFRGEGACRMGRSISDINRSIAKTVLNFLVVVRVAYWVLQDEWVA
jgi:hypothetical protein